MQDNLSLDRTMLAYVLKNKQHAMAVSAKTTHEYFHPNVQWLYKAIMDHFNNPKFKEIPTKNIIQEYLQKNFSQASFINNATNLYTEIQNLEVNPAEFTWYLEKLRVRYNDQVQRSCATSMVKMLREPASNEQDRIEKINEIIRKSVTTIDSIYRQEAYQEGSLDESAKDRANRYKQVEANPDIARGILTGFSDFDRITNGLHGGELIIVGGPTSCQPAGSKVLMFDGKWKNVEDIVVGDKILSPQIDGSTTVDTVINTTRSHDIDIYRVQTKDKHKLSYMASHNHILPIICATSTRKNKGKNKLVEMSIDEFNFQSDDWKKHARLFTNPAYDLPEQDLALPPYFVGLMLGDGSLGKYPTITSEDYEIFDRLEKLNISMGGVILNKKSKAVSRNITKTSRVLLNEIFGTDLVSHSKFIPDVYMRSSLQQRLELLAGLIDTDGTFEEFSSTSYQLANDFKNLVISVGGRATLAERYTSYEKEGKKFKSFRVHFNFAEFVPPTSLKRKSRFKKGLSPRNPRNRAFETVYVGKDTVYGFTLDGKSQWYITDNNIVTHNTGKSIVMQNMAVNALLGGYNPLDDAPTADVIVSGCNVLYFSLEMPKQNQERRIDACMAGIPYNSIRDGKLTSEEKEKYFKVLKFQKNFPRKFYIVDMPRGATIREVELKHKEMEEKYGIKFNLSVIDYLGIMKPTVQQSQDWLNLGFTSEEMHEYARAFNIPVITGTQINRPKDPNKPQHSTDRVARSDMIPSNANIILQIGYRGDDEHTRLDMPMYFIKNRDGEKTSFTLIKNFACMQVKDMVDETFGNDGDDDVV